MRTNTLIPLLATVAALGCNTFDPDLGTTPFKCGVVEPRCPDDYTCVQTGPSTELCVANSQDPNAIPDAGDDPGEFSCNDDPAEINNSTLDATPTGVPDQPDQRFVGLAICPANDADYFAFRVAANTSPTVTLTLEVGNGDGVLTLEMVGTNGEPIGGPAMPDPADATKLVKSVTNTPPDQYFAKVTGDGVGQNNYNIEITLQ